MSHKSVLAKHLEDEYEISDIDSSSWGDCLFEVGNMEYLVCNEAEKAVKLKEYIIETLWAFNADFLASYISGDPHPDTLNPLLEQYEDANPLLLTLVGDNIDNLISDAEGADGAGHFLSSYDGDEIEVTHNGEYFFIYRVN